VTATEAPGATSVRAYSDVEYVFEPHSAAMPALRPYLSDLWERRRFVTEMARADIRGKRSSAVVGQLWAVLDPLFQAAIYFFLLTVLRGGSRGAADLCALIFCVFMFSLTLVALNDGGRSIITKQSLVLNSTFPRAMLPLASIYKGLLGLVPAMCVYVVIHLACRQPIGAGIAVLPLLLIIQTVLCAGLAMLTATITVFVRDMTNALTYLTRLLLFTTPVIYSASTLTPGLQRILAFNPFFALFNCYRAVVAGQMPPGGSVLQATLWAAVYLVIGARVFLSHERAFAMRL
jgi:teichoic acid transport system permease protein